MARDPAKLDIVNENHSDSEMNSEIERIFGKPPKIGTGNDHGTYVNGNSRSGDSDTEHPSQPLLEPSRDKQLPPLAGPEIDDLDGDPPKDATPYPGIDDGLLEPTDSKPTAPTPEHGVHDGEREPGDEHHVHHTNGGPVPTDDTSGLEHRFGIDDRAISPVPGIIPDVNTYQQKKNLAQGMMDLALLSANANQLRYVLETSKSHPYYYPSLIFIALSIIIQIIVGIGLIMNSRYDVNNDKDICKANKINNMTVIGIFLITIVNVFITSFSVATPQGATFQQLRANSSF